MPLCKTAPEDGPSRWVLPIKAKRQQRAGWTIRAECVARAHAHGARAHAHGERYQYREKLKVSKCWWVLVMFIAAQKLNREGTKCESHNAGFWQTEFCRRVVCTANNIESRFQPKLCALGTQSKKSRNRLYYIGETTCRDQTCGQVWAGLALRYCSRVTQSSAAEKHRSTYTSTYYQRGMQQSLCHVLKCFAKTCSRGEYM